MVQSTDKASHYRKLVQDWYDIFCTFEPEKYEHLVEPDAYYKVGHDEHRGHEGFATIAKMSRFLYPNGMKFEITDSIVEGNKVAVQITTRAVTNKGEDYENYYSVHLHFSEEDRIAELYEFTDMAYALQKFSLEGFEEYLAS